jgi:UDP-2,4-diacetamido-2,4,6-trideoxy-beta-L-altropyranose hydrolase
MKVAIRTDASLHIGTGHVMRCLTLAERLRAAGAEVLFVCREHQGHLCQLVAARGYQVARLAPPAPGWQAPSAPAHVAWLGAPWPQDAADTAAALPWRPDWLLVDHYGIERQWQQALRPAVARIMVVDDLADRVHDCDLLLDQNLADQPQARYDGLVPAYCQRLLGPHFALLRPEFAAARAALTARDGQVRRVFVFIGGADPGNETGRVLRALAALGQVGLQVDVVIGAANPHHAALAAQCAALPGARLHRQVDNMAQLMAGADLAIGAGGGAMWERCSVGLPSVVLAVADNQQPGCDAMARHGRVLYLGQAAALAPGVLPAALQLACASPWLLQHMAAASQALVDGRGAERVVRRMAALQLAGGLQLRRALADDCERLWEWRNAEPVRRFSGDGAPIPLAQHRQWFAAALADPDRLLLIGEIDGQAAGVLRYDRRHRQATVSVYLTPAFLGQGIGASLIAAGSASAARQWPQLEVIEAQVRPQNVASAAVFETAGFAKEFDIYTQRIKA